jgi:hypothetical protein
MAMNTHLFQNVGLLLAGMVAKGYCTIEQFDIPPVTWQVMQANVLARSEQPPEYVNECRRWIEQHPGDWKALQALHAEQRDAWLQGATSRPAPRYPVVRRGAPEPAADPAPAAAGFAADDAELVSFLEPEAEWAA